MKIPPPPLLTRHQFLATLHTQLAPVAVYLEVGVQTGASIALAADAGVAIGIDPELGLFHQEHRRDNQRLYAQTSDQYFGCESCERHTIDIGFIDGSHLFEDALRDFIYMERHAGSATVVVFDDVAPYSQDIAWRVQPPGDWTGDVFKIMAILAEYRPDLTQRLVDVTPTGALMVTGLDPRNVVLERHYDKIVAEWLPRHHVPDDVLNRVGALSPDVALAELADRITALRKRGVRA